MLLKQQWRRYVPFQVEDYLDMFNLPLEGSEELQYLILSNVYQEMTCKTCGLEWKSTAERKLYTLTIDVPDINLMSAIEQHFEVHTSNTVGKTVVTQIGPNISLIFKHCRTPFFLFFKFFLYSLKLIDKTWIVNTIYTYILVSSELVWDSTGRT